MTRKPKVHPMRDKVHPMRDFLIEAIAEFLTSELGRKSIELEMGKPDAKAWSRMFTRAGCRGYPTEREAQEALRRVLLGEK